MGKIARSAASLRVIADDLDPQLVTRLLGVPASLSKRKGEETVTRRGDTQIARTGVWILKAEDLRPGDVDRQIVELLHSVSKDDAVWADLRSRFKIDLFCGLWVQEPDEGFELRAETLALIASRGLSLGICVYALTADDALMQSKA